ncbi:beta-alanine transporter [Ischnura elegans]|uniref:beta-alanine transporter n=1 Tax=Ischnura elegans TaxID=197161 RepID=UPI001ED88245|nr:beta-alanine transporter [Ischnura elegans]
MDLDALLPDVGEFGTYQKALLWFVLLPGVFPCGFHAYNQLFMASKPDHWCRVPELEAAQVTGEAAKRLSIPREWRDGALRYNQCRMYDRNYTALLERAQSASTLEPPSSPVPTSPATSDALTSSTAQWSSDDGGGFDSGGTTPSEVPIGLFLASYLTTPPQDTEEFATTPCKHGWSFDDSEYSSTVVIEWEMVCDHDFQPTLALVLLGVGGLIGSYIFGYIQDTLGRRPAFFIYLFINCLFGIATAFAQDFTTWTVFRFGVGFTVPAILGTPYVLAIEMVGPTKRTMCSIFSNIAYSLALVALAAVVYYVRDWRHLSLATSVPFLTFFLWWWVMPESPRWLLANGRYDEAEKVLLHMAKVNKRQLPANYMFQLKRKYLVERDTFPGDMKVDDDKRTYGVMDLFRTPNLRRKTLIITFIWFTNTSVYVGLSYYAPSLGGDEFLNFFLAGAVELPTYLFLWPAMDYLGRRWTLCSSMVVGGAACLATVLVQNNEDVTLALYCIGKMGISSSFVVLPLMATELYPTVVRGLGISTSSVVGMIGPILIPLVNYLGTEMLVLPLLVMGFLLVAGGATSLLLPETLKQHLPQTLEDGEAFGADWGPKEWLSCKIMPAKPSPSVELQQSQQQRQKVRAPRLLVQPADVTIFECDASEEALMMSKPMNHHSEKMSEI